MIFHIVDYLNVVHDLLVLVCTCDQSIYLVIFEFTSDIKWLITSMPRIEISFVLSYWLS
jgi:hypothetical protein